jgi:hypothetical protein
MVSSLEAPAQRVGVSQGWPSGRLEHLLMNRDLPRTIVDATLLKKHGYGLEAIKRLRAGRSIIIGEGNIIIEEFPDGRRQQMDVDQDNRPVKVRDLPPAPWAGELT